MSDPGSRRRLKRTLKRIAVEFEAETVEGSGHVGSVRLDGLFIRTDKAPPRGEAVRVRFADLNGSELEVSGVVRRAPEVDAKPGFFLHIDHVPDDYLEFYDQVLTR